MNRRNTRELSRKEQKKRTRMLGLERHRNDGEEERKEQGYLDEKDEVMGRSREKKDKDV